MVVRMDAGRDAVRQYIAEQAARGRDYVVSIVESDNRGFVPLLAGITEEEAFAVTPVDEWAVFEALRHMATGLARNKLRIETLASGRPFESQAGAAGQAGPDYASFDELRRAYADGMTAIIEALRAADPRRGLELTSENAAFGRFNWLEWAVFLHYVHTNDHRGQIEAIVAAQRERRA